LKLSELDVLIIPLFLYNDDSLRHGGKSNGEN